MAIGIVSRPGLLIAFPIAPRMNPLLPLLFAHQIHMQRCQPLAFPRLAITPPVFRQAHNDFLPLLLNHMLFQPAFFRAPYLERAFAPRPRVNRRYNDWAENGRMLMPRIPVPYHNNGHLYPRVARPVNRQEPAINAEDQAEAAKKKNGEFLKSIVEKQDDTFKQQLKEADAEIFDPLARLAIEKAAKDKTIPPFMEKHAAQINELRGLSDQQRKQKMDDLTWQLMRERDFIEAMQNAN